MYIYSAFVGLVNKLYKMNGTYIKIHKKFLLQFQSCGQYQAALNYAH